MQIAEQYLGGAKDRLGELLDRSGAGDYLSKLDLKPLMLPAIAGATLGGAAMLGGSRGSLNETDQQRRRRKLRAATAGIGMGAVAGAAVPTGLRLLRTPSGAELGGVPILERGFDGLVNTTVGNAGMLAGGGLAGYGIHRYNKEKFRQARENLPGLLNSIGAKGVMGDIDSNLVAGRPDQAYRVLEKGLQRVGADILPERASVRDSGKLHSMLNTLSRRGATQRRDAYMFINDPATREKFMDLIMRENIDRRIPISIDDYLQRMVPNRTERRAVGGLARQFSKLIPESGYPDAFPELVNRFESKGLGRKTSMRMAEVMQKLVGGSRDEAMGRFVRRYDRLFKGNFAGRAGRAGLLGAGLGLGALAHRRLTGN